ncbi:PAS domain S-box-containing protein [Sphingomonas sp. OV641]|uniref:hybrid sensor histidine kinase/response regulator n=1 Tax=Sphingomonas sp. OV641 TaxID=1881068 RepID=UPI0008CF492F|nr:PAS domain-containing protein [Sphingomonas sp. OV641]SEJ66922.1 PAS domain S-box-containing protein [Sphingomonas sp. OV641]
MTTGEKSRSRGEVLSEAPFRQLADHLPTLCFIADRDGRIMWCNRRWHDFTGVPRDADPERAWPQVHDPVSLPDIRERWHEAVKSGLAGDAVISIRSGSGEFRPFLTRAEPVRTPEGEISCWLGTMTDITEQREAERDQRILIALNDALRDELDAARIEQTVDALLRGHLGVEGIAIIDVEEDDGAGVDGGIRIPLFTHGAVAATFHIRTGTPRAWRPTELRLIEEAVERTWAALERATAERARRESEARQRAIVEATPECVKIVAEDGTLLYMNGAGLRMIDAEPEQASGLHVPALVAADHRARWMEQHRRVCAGEAAAWEFDVVGLQGNRRRMETHAVPLPAPDGTMQQLAVTRDVTERHAAEERLRASEALLAGFMKNAPVGMYLKDAEGRYLMLNPEMAKVFGRPIDEVIGRTAAELFGAEQATMIAAHDRRILERRMPERVEEFLPDLDAYGWSLVVRFPVLVEGEQARIGGFDIDLSERKRAEAELARSREMVFQSEKLTALGSLLAGVSHELNNPLSVILTLSQLLEAQAQGTPLGERAAKIRAAAGRCARIVQSFLAMARQKAPVRTRVDANELIHAALDLASYGLRTAGIEVVQRLDPALPPLDVDSDQLSQVLLNLIVNAQHALEESDGTRTLVISTEAVGAHGNDRRRGMVRITVADNGPGVPAEIRHRIFEPFFTSKPQGVGTGIGLAFSLGVVEAHGGTLRLVEDAPWRQGACFVAELPAATGAMPKVAAPSPIVPPNDRASALVVDDDRDVGEALAELLADEGYDVELACSGQEAKTRLCQRRYDAVLSDLRMPDMDGRALFDWMTDQLPDQLARLAFVTGDTLGASSRSFLARAGRPVLEKPYDMESLRGLLHALHAPGKADARAVSP